jgi:hypothetical protein
MGALIFTHAIITHIVNRPGWQNKHGEQKAFGKVKLA